MILRRLIALLSLVLLVAGLSACGRRGDPQLPAGVTDEYPRGYPAGARPPDENIFNTQRPR